MDKLIQKYFCSDCLNKSKSCMELEIIEDSRLTSCRCINYIRNSDVPLNTNKELEDYRIRSNKGGI